MRVAGVGKSETRHGWWVRVTGGFNPNGCGCGLVPPPGFTPAAIPNQEQQAELPALSITSSLFPNQPVSSFAPFSCRPSRKCSRMHLWVGVWQKFAATPTQVLPPESRWPCLRCQREAPHVVNQPNVVQPWDACPCGI
jgi:hypothetical protein